MHGVLSERRLKDGDMFIRSTWAKVAVALGASALIAAGSVVPANAAGKEFIDLQNFAAGEPDHIDPNLTSTLVGANVALLLFDTLTDTDANGALQPSAADKWSTPDQGKTWVFTLKKNGKFSNGEPVLPSSFVRGFKRAADPKLASEVAYHTYFIKGMEDYNNGKGAFPTSSYVADDKKMTLTIKMVNTTVDFPSIAQHTVFSPLPKSMDNAPANVEEDGLKLIGNGPYKLAAPIAKRTGGQIVLVPNTNYAGKKPTLSKITFKISADVNAALNAFRSGQGDNAPIPAGQFDSLTKQYGTLGVKTTLGTDYWAFNWDDAVVGGAKNVLLRSAIVKAVDRDAISRVIYEGVRKPTGALVPPGIPGYVANNGQSTKRDLAGAKKDFAAWVAKGNKISSPLRLSYNEGSNWDKVASIISANLKDAGIDSKLDPFPADGTYFTKMRNGQGQIVRAGWFADYPLMDNFLFPLLDSASIGGDNLARYANNAYDALIDKARATVDAKKAQAIYRQAEQVAVVQDKVIMPTVNRGVSSVVSKKVSKYPITPLGMVLYNEIVKN